ncbi:hypothetical protein D3C80_1551750 [compost metagenome]
MRSRMLLNARLTSTTSLPPASATGATSAPSDISRAARARRFSGQLCQCTSKPMNSNSKAVVSTMKPICWRGRRSASSPVYGSGNSEAMYNHSPSPKRICVTSTGGFSGSRVSE